MHLNAYCTFTGHVFCYMYESKRYHWYNAAIVYAIRMRDGSIPSHSIDVDHGFCRYFPTHQTKRKKKNDLVMQKFIFSVTRYFFVV